jgi:hypothetical protein
MCQSANVLMICALTLEVKRNIGAQQALGTGIKSGERERRARTESDT